MELLLSTGATGNNGPGPPVSLSLWAFFVARFCPLFFLYKYMPSGFVSVRLQFSLRSMLLTLLLASVVMAALAQAAHRRRAAIKLIRRGGGVVNTYFIEDEIGGVWHSFRRRLGIQRRHVEVLFLERMGERHALLKSGDGTADTITDRDVAPISDISDTSAVVLRSDQVTASVFNTLSALPHLSRLELAATGIAEHELGGIRRCKHLTDLTLRLEVIGDGALKEIAGMPQLRRLNLIGVKASDDGLLQLGTLTNLKSMVLYGDRLNTGTERALGRSLPRCDIIAQGMGLQLIGEAAHANESGPTLGGQAK